MSERLEPLLHFEQLPLMVGTRETPSNGQSLPDALPFDLMVDLETAQLRQSVRPAVTAALDRAYQIGSLLGTAMDDTPLGHRYCSDVLAFVRTVVPDLRGRRVLEIGAGHGFLLRCLRDLGADAIGLEPGEANRPHWERHQVDVIPDFFPTARCPGPFDLVVAYAVLEHLVDPEVVLREIREHLTPNGVTVLAVPDDEPDISAGDPAMLVHEHFGYFTGPILRRVTQRAQFTIVRAARSGYGGALYIAGTPDRGSASPDSPDAQELAQARQFGARCGALCAAVRERVELRAGRPLGVYCPARGVNLLQPGAAYRFFDDDDALHGRFYPPFHAPVESREQLVADPPDELWILSRTFGPTLADQLRAVPALGRTMILTIAELEADIATEGQP